jgi:hypothetical protein
MKKIAKTLALVAFVLLTAIACTEENVTPQTGNNTGGNVSEKGF